MSVRTTNTAVRVATYAHVQQLLFGVPLAATEERIAQIVDAVGPRLVGLATESGAIEVRAELMSDSLPEPDEIELDAMGVAIIPVRGTFAPHAGAMDAMSGLMSYERLAGLVEATAGRPGVRGLVLAYDSPGGTVTGMLEAAARLRALRARLPVYAVAEYAAASAAYVLAAAAERVFVPPTGVLGSIGAFAVRRDATEADRVAGLRYTFVRSGARKGDGDPHKPMAADERDALQRRVDQSAALMFEAIAATRPLEIAAIAAHEAAVFMGVDAVGAKLADELGGVAEAVRALHSRLGDRRVLPFTARSGAALAHESARHDGSATGTEEMPMSGTATTGQETTSAPATEAAASASATGSAAPPPAVTPVAGADKVIPIEAAHRLRDDALAAREQEQAEIVALCADFRCPERAGEFITAKRSRREVFATLQAERVKADEAQATRGTFGGTGTTKQLDPKAYDTHWNAAMAAAQALRPAAL